MGLEWKQIILAIFFTTSILTLLFTIGYGFGYKDAMIDYENNKKDEPECLVYLDNGGKQNGIYDTNTIYEQDVETSR